MDKNISKTKGNFTNFSTNVIWDEENPTRSSLSAEIYTNSVFTNNKKRDNHLKSKDFFNTQKYPKITFKSTSIHEVEDGYEATGLLTIKNITLVTTIPVAFIGIIKDNQGKEHIGLEATFTINRQENGMTFNKKLQSGYLIVGNKVTINISFEGIKN